MEPRIEAASLTTTRHLARGGIAADVSEVLNFRLPESPELRLVYKRFSRRPSAVVPIYPLESHARLRLDMPPEQRRVLDEQFCWVLRVVVDGEPGAAGVLTQHWDETYMADHSSAGGDMQRSPADGSRLASGADYFGSRNITAPSPAQRLALCRSLALAIGRLHRAGAIYGNLSLSEFLYRVEPAPSVMFHSALHRIRLRGAPPPVGVLSHDSDWVPPEALAAQQAGNRVGYDITNVETDRYKLGLAILRILVAPTSPKGSSSEIDPSRAKGLVPDDIYGLLSQCLLGDPNVRPTARDWYLALDRYV